MRRFCLCSDLATVQPGPKQSLCPGVLLWHGSCEDNPFETEDGQEVSCAMHEYSYLTSATEGEQTG